MRITLLPSGPDTALESHRPRRRTDWQLVTMGFWSESPYHGGAIAYSLANPKPGTWLLQSGEWSEEEDELREETDYHRIIAVAEDVPAGHDAVKMAKMLYEAWIAAHPAKAVSEQDTSGLLDVE